MSETYFDNAEVYPWEKEERLDVLSAHDEQWKCSCSVTIDGVVYDLEAVVTFSYGVPSLVEDIETLNANPEEYER